MCSRALAAVGLVAFSLGLLPCAHVSAHGLAPDAYAVLSQDAAGLRAVSLSAGVALRRTPQRYQYVCPALWGDQFPAPVVALADGTLVLGASSGLMLLSEDGALRAHPDPAAVGRSTSVVRTPRGVFAQRDTAEGSEVIAVDAQTVRVLWKDAKSLYSMAALDDKLVLVRESGRMLEQVALSFDGAVVERQLGVLDLPVDNVVARANAGVAYALILYRNSSVALGTLRMNVFNKLAEGELMIGGPLSQESGTLLAVDGKLTQMINGQATPLADPHFVVCLGQHEGLTYACDEDGIAPVTGQTLGEPVFRFSWLTAPDLSRVPEGEARMRCIQQWLDLRMDLVITGTSLLEESMPTAAGTPPAPGAQAGAGAPLPGAAIAAGSGAAGSAPMTDSGAGLGQPIAPAPASGCTAAPRRSGGATDASVLGVVLGLSLARACRRRPRRP